ncbi:MAG: terpene cyclase/mutase family protein [Planctomycetes bacterium]|nr:terpene cyclase/mutase family protein [Planctomycetota bacterium]
MTRRTKLLVTLCLFLLGSPVIADELPRDDPPPSDIKALAAARERGLDWLTKNQASDGSWGTTYTIAVTSFACLSYLGGSDEPFTGERGRVLLKGLSFLMANQSDGQFTKQGHTWIHGQGFGTLALSEAYGRSLFAKTKPDIDTQQIRGIVGQAVQVIANNQSTSGGWWYAPGSPGSHEGSTTVCAVQALVSASNYGIKIDTGVLARGFDYLKQCQNADGGFDYKLGDATSMKEGTAGGVATLGLMKKFDYSVMIKGYNFLLKITPAEISSQRFPYYGHFYGCMGMHLLRQEFGRDKEYFEKTSQYIAEAQKDVLSWRQENGEWPTKGSVSGEGKAYGTAFASLLLSGPDGRLSIYNRRSPDVPRDDPRP